jgi:hypothetical protein
LKVLNYKKYSDITKNRVLILWQAHTGRRPWCFHSMPKQLRYGIQGWEIYPERA